MSTATEGWGAERSRTITWHDPEATALAGLGLSGLDYLQSMADGRLPASPITRLVGLLPQHLEEGEAAFDCVADASWTNPLGIVHGGLVCTLLDSATASAVHTTLPAGTGFTSLEIKVSYLRTVRAGDRLSVVGRVTRRGRRVCFAEAEVRDVSERLVATASSTLLVLPLPAA